MLAPIQEHSRKPDEVRARIVKLMGDVPRLEMLINHTNQVYRNLGMALVTKRPTPVKLVKTQGTRVLSAFIEAASTVDYEGCYRGRSLQFEARQTKQELRFDLDNVHEHQV